MGDIGIGIALAITSASSNALGVNLQRLGKRTGSHLLNLTGVGLAVLCGPLDLASFGFAPQSLLAPFGALSLVVNLLLAPLIHGDAITRIDVFSTSLVCAGVAACLSNANQEPHPYSLVELGELAAHPHFCAWLAFLALVIGGSVTHVCFRGISSPGAAATLPIASGGIGSCTVLQAKALTEFARAGAPRLLLGTLTGGAALCGLLQIAILNLALGAHSSLVVLPHFVATMVAASGIGGGIFFQEFAAAGASASQTYLAGLFAIIAGVLALRNKKDPTAKQD